MAKQHASVKVEKAKFAHEARDGSLPATMEALGFSIFAWQDKPGAYYAEYSHPVDEFLVVESGCIVFVIDGIEYDLKIGDFLTLPAGTNHCAEVKGRSPAKYLICTRS